MRPSIMVTPHLRQSQVGDVCDASVSVSSWRTEMVDVDAELVGAVALCHFRQGLSILQGNTNPWRHAVPRALTYPGPVRVPILSDPRI